MGYCCTGTLLQSCNRSNKFLCKCQKWRYYSKREELKKSDLTEYFLIGTFLPCCKRNNYFLCECQKWGHFSEKNLFVTFVYLIKTWKCFLVNFFYLDQFSKFSKYFIILFHFIEYLILGMM